MNVAHLSKVLKSRNQTIDMESFLFSNGFLITNMTFCEKKGGTEYNRINNSLVMSVVLYSNSSSNMISPNF